MMNILLQKFDTPRDTAPFDKINTQNFLPALLQSIEEAEIEIKKITDSDEPPTFQNVIEALAYSGEKLERVSALFFNLNSAETNDAMQLLAQEIAPILSNYANKIAQNEALFAKIKTIHDNKENWNLNEEQKTLLENTYKGFVRNGALLTQNKKERYKEIDHLLSIKSLQFGENVLSATNLYYKHITNVEELEGIPEDILHQYAQEAKDKGLEGWVITLQYPSYIPLMTYAKNRALREELALANGKKAFDGGQYDNTQIILDIVSLRDEKAKLLGYTNYAAYVLEERMAKSIDGVLGFLNALLIKAKPFALNEIEELKNLAKKDGIEELKSHDHSYYAEKLRKQKYDLDDEELKPFFPLGQVQNAVFYLAKKLFGLEFIENKAISTYHPDVDAYEVMENGTYKAVLYVDYHPRKGKRAGAWMTSYKNQSIKNNENQRPHISIVCNFSKPTQEKPSLLTFSEVTTLFHEFGHALHGILANTQYPNLSGTSVKWDFVELPSQFLENYCYEPEFLKTFALHYQTKLPLSNEKIKKIAQSKNFMQGYQTLRQIGFGILDMKYHSDPELLKKLGVKAFEMVCTKESQLYPISEETAMSPSFSHIFQGGYAAGYYSYKWAEVLDADAFQFFKENGIFDPQTAQSYKKLLSAGGTIDPMVLYTNFRGTEPQVESLLKRAFESVEN